MVLAADTMQAGIWNTEVPFLMVVFILEKCADDTTR